MNDKDNFDNFFKSRLQQEAAEAQWNTPSEEVWNKASVHFPQKKRRRRFFFIFPFLGLTAFAALAIYSTIYFSKTPSQISTVEKIKQSAADKQALIQNEVVSTEVPNSSIRRNEIPQEKNTQDNNNNKENLVKQAKTTIKDTDNYSNFENKPAQVLSFRNKVSRTPSHNEIGNTNRGLDQQNSQHVTPEMTLRLPSTNNEPKASNTDESISNTNSLIEASRNPEELMPSIKKKRIERTRIESLSIQAFAIKTELPEAPVMKLISTENNYSTRSWSIGLSTDRFLDNPFASSDLSEEYRLRSSYIGLNIPITKRISRNSFISSGIYAYDIDVDIDFEVLDIYNENLPSESISQSVIKSANIGVLSLSENNTSSIMVEFLPNTIIENGEEITLRAGFPITLKVFSLPITYNRYFKTKLFTHYLSAGISFDMFHISIDDLTLDVFREGQMISESVSIDPIQETEYGGSIYLGMGTQYDFTASVFGHIGLKADIFDLKFSRLEFGINYRL